MRSLTAVVPPLVAAALAGQGGERYNRGLFPTCRVSP